MKKKTITVVVRKKHWIEALKRARRSGDEFLISDTDCPLALAIKERGSYARVPNPENALVDTTTFKLDAAGRKIVKAFDGQEWEEEDLPKLATLPIPFKLPLKVKLTQT